MATIQILGTGCPRCGQLALQAEEAVRNAGRQDVIEKITDIVRILEFSPMALPALAINGRVVAAGTGLSSQQIVQLLEASTNSVGGR